MFTSAVMVSPSILFTAVRFRIPMFFIATMTIWLASLPIFIAHYLTNMLQNRRNTLRQTPTIDESFSVPFESLQSLLTSLMLFTLLTLISSLFIFVSLSWQHRMDSESGSESEST